MQERHPPIITVVLVFTTMLSGGCSVIGSKVECELGMEPSAGTGTVDVVAVASGNDDCIAACNMIEMQKWDQAAMHAERAVAANSNDHRAHYIAGLAYEKLGQYEQADEHYERAALLTKPPENAPYTGASRRCRAKMGG